METNKEWRKIEKLCTSCNFSIWGDARVHAKTYVMWHLGDNNLMSVKLNLHSLEKLRWHASVICVCRSLNRVGGKETWGASTTAMRHAQRKSILNCFSAFKRIFIKFKTNGGVEARCTQRARSAILMQLRELKWISIVIYISNLKCHPSRVLRL